jgi:hypothetical protein
MKDTDVSESNSTEAGSEEMRSALFAHLVIQQSNMALMLLGKVAHPESGKTVRDLEAAKLFIDQLEMLEAKTKGNLSREESAMLKQNLMALRMAFVEAVEPSPPQAEAQPQKAERSAATAGKSEGEPGPAIEAAEEHRKKFTKKY